MTHDLTARDRLALLLLAVFTATALTVHGGGDAKQTVRQKPADDLTTLMALSASELKTVLDMPLPNDHALSDHLDTPQYKLTMGWIRDFVDDYVARSMMESKAPPPLPPALAAEYARRLKVAGVLYEKDPNAVADWFWSRRDREHPTILDALLLAATDTSAGAAAEPFRKGLDLFNAKNPIARMFAARHVAQVAREEERAALVEQAMSDSYWYTRKMALNYARGMEPEKRDPILRRYLEASKKESVAEQFATRKASIEKEIEGMLKKPDSK
jgi:hypothetical protein